jgi:hypothetical protein
LGLEFIECLLIKELDKGIKMSQHTLDYKSAPKYKVYKQRAIDKFPNDCCITEEEFKKISNSNCYYCNTTGPNGIDRVNNTIGYSLNNCVPACKHCNYVKGDLLQEDFNIWKNRFIAHQLKEVK